jgi:hypothetical protein
MDANDYTVRITKVGQEQAYNADGKLVDTLRVDFNVGNHGPFIKRFAAAGFDQNAAKAELQQFALSLQQLGT